MSDEFDFVLSRETLYEQVANKIERMIIKESFQAGDKLPGERELADRIGVSRTVVREAIRVLSVRGLVVIRQGSGTFVQKLGPKYAAAPISRLLKHRNSSNSLQDLCEVRRTLEIEIAGLAAERATREDIEDMEEAITEMRNSVGDAAAFAKHDLAFHSALAAATHNDLYSVLLTPISDLLLEFRLTDYKHDPKGTIEGGMVHHHLLLEKIKMKDVEGARRAMKEHLEQAERVFAGASKNAEPTN